MFNQLKEKFNEATEKLRSLTYDDADKAIAELITKGTSDDLIDSDWTINMQLVDVLNQQGEPR